MNRQDTYVIRDWMNSPKFGNREFDTFDDAEEFLNEYLATLNLSDEDEQATREEYWIRPKSEATRTDL